MADRPADYDPKGSVAEESMKNHSGYERLDNPVAGSGSSEVARRVLNESACFRATGSGDVLRGGYLPAVSTPT